MSDSKGDILERSVRSSSFLWRSPRFLLEVFIFNGLFWTVLLNSVSYHPGDAIMSGSMPSSIEALPSEFDNANSDFEYSSDKTGPNDILPTSDDEAAFTGLFADTDSPQRTLHRRVVDYRRRVLARQTLEKSLHAKICHHPACQRLSKSPNRNAKPLEFDFDFVFNCVVVFSNAIVLLSAAILNCSLCSCSGWMGAVILVNVLCPGIVVIIDTLPAELGTYLIMVICESMLWLSVAVWRLKDSFQKQSEFILALLLYSLCTSYVAWSGPALYVEVDDTTYLLICQSLLDERY